MDIRTRQQAFSLGVTTYFTGKPCKHGHIAERQVSSFGCVVCARNVYKRWRARNLDSEMARRIAYVTENRELVNRRKREIRAANKEKIRAERRRGYEKNPEKHRKRSSDFRAQNPEIVKQAQAAWKQNNRAYATARQRQRDAARLNATPAWADLEAIRRIYEECERVSVLTRQPHQVDHFYPLRGKLVCGLHVETNLRVIHATLNRKKGNRVEEPV